MKFLPLLLCAVTAVITQSSYAIEYQSVRGIKMHYEQRQREAIRNEAAREALNRPARAPTAPNNYEYVGMLGGTLSNMAARMQSRNVETVRILSETDKRNIIEGKARGGDVSSAVLAADIYRSGYNVAKDEKQALYWYERAAELGDVASQNEVAWKYFFGETLPRNIPNAVKWFSKAAEANSGEAQYMMGVLTKMGAGGLQADDAKALAWYQKSAVNGNAAGLYAMGIRYHDGAGIAQDYGKALAMFERSAKQNHADAQYNLATMYQKGRGVPANWDSLVTAQTWYEKSAENENVNAQFMMCMNNASGIGTKRDYRRAEFWCERAIKNGDDEAKDLLASIKQEVRKNGYGDKP